MFSLCTDLIKCLGSGVLKPEKQTNSHGIKNHGMLAFCIKSDY